MDAPRSLHDLEIANAKRLAGYATASVAAARFGLTNPRLIRRWAREGRIASYRPPGAWFLYSLTDIEKLIRESAVPPPGAGALIQIEARLAERRRFEARRRAKDEGEE